MNRHICLGSQLYINKYDTEEIVREAVRKMNSSGLAIIRLFMIWDILEPRQNEWNFSVFDACFEEAQSFGMKIVPTLMPVSPPGWAKLTRGSQDVADIDNPEIWKAGLDYVEKTVKHYCGHQALHSWILWNEPSRYLKPCPSNIRDFSQYLERKYKTTDEYNKTHYRQFTGFNDLTENYLKAGESLAFKPYSDKIDELDYAVYNLCRKLKDIAAVVKGIDRVHPVHINPHDMIRGGYTDGQNFFEEGKTTDFLGCSAHPSWHSTDFSEKRIPLSVGYFAEISKAASKDKNRFWVTELQGGTNIFSGRDYLCPSAKDITLWLSECIGSGAESVVFWCFNTRNEGFEGGEWGLLNQLGEQSCRLNAVERFSEIINNNQVLFDASRPAAPDVYILYSDATLRLNMIETANESDDGIRNRNNGKLSAAGAFTAVTDMGLQPGIISEEQVRNGQLPKKSVLIMPDTYALEEGTIDEIYRFTEHGGTVIADGLCAMKTPEGRISACLLAKAEKLFGAKVEDITAAKEPYPVSFTEGKTFSEFLKLKFRITDAIKDGDILTNTVGKGKAVRIPGITFRRYFRKEEPGFLSLLKKYISVKKDVFLINPSTYLKIKALDSGNDKILFVINCGKENVTANISGVSECKSLSGHSFVLSENVLKVMISSEDSAILHIKL